jgi:hypothetical protein
MDDPVSSAFSAAPMQPQQGPSLGDMLASTWPARLAQKLYGAVTLPHDVSTGQVDPFSNEGFSRAMDLTGFLAGGGAPMAEKGALGTFGGMPETIRSAAIKGANGKIYEAPNHVLALDKAAADGTDFLTQSEGGDSGGFVTSQGRYVGRDEAARMTGVPGNRISESLRGGQ